MLIPRGAYGGPNWDFFYATQTLGAPGAAAAWRSAWMPVGHPRARRWGRPSLPLLRGMGTTWLGARTVGGARHSWRTNSWLAGASGGSSLALSECASCTGCGGRETGRSSCRAASSSPSSLQRPAFGGSTLRVAFVRGGRALCDGESGCVTATLDCPVLWAVVTGISFLIAGSGQPASQPTPESPSQPSMVRCK